jgi:ATP-dependent Clp protease ATP-binding subunit ClpA
MEFTDKTQEYLSAAVQLAKESGHIDLRPAHLGLALFEDNDGLAVQGMQVALHCVRRHNSDSDKRAMSMSRRQSFVFP